jgi:hypothetical protein
MRVVLSIGVSSATVLAATAVSAQPVPAPATCSVTIARAPDDVRDEVTRWVRAEPHCNATLEVRVVPTEGGLYLFARDGQGRVRERIVPDAQSVGVLVASWVADDSIETPPSTPGAVNADGSQALAIAGEPKAARRDPSDPSASWRLMAPPGKAPALLPGIERESALPSERAQTSWLTLGGIMDRGVHGGAGARAEIDLYTRAGWSIAAGLAVSGANAETYETGVGRGLHTRDFRAVAMVTHTWSVGDWQLRLGGGVGMRYISAVIESDPFNGMYQLGRNATEIMAPTVEASALVAHAFDNSWAIFFGPIATRYDLVSRTGGDTVELPRDGELMAFAGIRHRL